MIATSFWPVINRKSSSVLYALSMVCLSLGFRAHYPMGIHVVRLCQLSDELPDANCRYLWEDEEEPSQYVHSFRIPVLVRLLFEASLNSYLLLAGDLAGVEINRWAFKTLVDSFGIAKNCDVYCLRLTSASGNMRADCPMYQLLNYFSFYITFTCSHVHITISHLTLKEPTATYRNVAITSYIKCVHICVCTYIIKYC